MFSQILITGSASLGAGFVAQIFQALLCTDGLNIWLKSNSIQLQIALLAINSATLGATLSKIRDLMDKASLDKNAFSEVRAQMLLSIKEQITLIVLATITLVIWSSPVAAKAIPHFNVTLGSLLSGIFIYSVYILYDTAKSILIILDYD